MALLQIQAGHAVDVVVKPSRHTLLLERQVLLATLSHLCYEAARWVKAAAEAGKETHAKRRASVSATATFSFQV